MHNLKKILQSSNKKLKEAILKQDSNKLPDGSYVYELEADVTIPSEYILMMHFLGDIDEKIQKKIKTYILKNQNKEGGWPLFYDGKTDLSASVKAYYALKLSGLSIDDSRMLKARDCILKNGGAEKVNVFTRITLALFQQISWNSIPFMPIEIIKFPKWFPFNIYKISYWSRTVLVPLLIIMHKKPKATNPSGIKINEIFIKPAHYHTNVQGINDKRILSKLFLLTDKLARILFPLFPNFYKNHCLEIALRWVLERLNGEDGLGGIFPAMVNSLLALHLDKKNRFKNEIKIVRKSIDKLIIEKKNHAYCQPCVSPVWDTGWMGLVHLENDYNDDKIANWFLKKEIKTKGDWCINNAKLKPGGWAFQFNNDFYPDVDDTALVGMFLHRYNKKKRSKAINKCLERTRSWILSMQSKNGGWGAFDKDNNKFYLNSIPFADHGALLDPPTADVSARCLSFLKQYDDPRDYDAIKLGIKYLLSEQEVDGSWFGRWGTNYIYGTWSVLSALNLIDFSGKSLVVAKASSYLKRMQRDDGGWGEDGKSYYSKHKNYSKKSTPSQTAWALMGLLASGDIDSTEVYQGVKYLLNNKWNEDFYTAVGFPRVFYLKYHGYAKYFPLLALSKINNQISKNTLYPNHGV